MKLSKIFLVLPLIILFLGVESCEKKSDEKKLSELTTVCEFISAEILVLDELIELEKKYSKLFQRHRQLIRSQAFADTAGSTFNDSSLEEFTKNENIIKYKELELKFEKLVESMGKKYTIDEVKDCEKYYELGEKMKLLEVYKI